jgi:ribonuclease VapC
MIADSSAVIAILRAEPEAGDCLRAIVEADCRRISAANFLESAIIVDGWRDAVARRRFDDFFREFEFTIEPVTEDQARIAREAYRDFGKGNHPARLNYGDCFAYALAKARRETLLFKGGDFSRTDVVSALGETLKPSAVRRKLPRKRS